MTSSGVASEVSLLDRPDTMRLRWWAKLLIVAFGLSLLLVGLGDRVLTRHEVLAAYPAKEMLQYGHWILPMFAGIPRTAKPPTTGWFIAGCMKVFHSDAEWVVRLPSVAAGVLTALLTACFAARFFGNRIGLISGLMLLTSYAGVMQARLAEADILVAATVTGAMTCLAFGTIGVDDTRPRRAPRWLSILFYTCAGMAFLLKAVPVLFVILTTAAYAAMRRNRAIGRFLWSPTGIGIFLTMLIAWPVATYLKHPTILRAWKYELFGRMGGAVRTDPLWTYLATLPQVLLPWTPAVMVGLWVLIRRGLLRTDVGQLMACWLLPGLILLHFSAQKSKHYAIPLLGPLWIAGAAGLLAYIDFQYRNPKPRRLLAAICLLTGCVGGIIAVNLIPQAKPMARMFMPIIAVVAVGGLAAIYMEHRRNLAGQLTALFAMMWLVIAGVEYWLIPANDDFKVQAVFARKASELVPASERIYIIDPPEEDAPQDDSRFRPEPYVAYYLRPPIWRFSREKAFAEFTREALARPSAAVYVVISKAQTELITPLGHMDVLLRSELRPREKEPRRLMLVRLLPSDSAKE